MIVEKLTDRVYRGIVSWLQGNMTAAQDRIDQFESQPLSRRVLLFRLLRQIRGLWGLVIFTVIARLVGQYANIAILTLAAWGLGRVLVDPSSVSYGHVMTELVLFGLVKGVFYYLENYLGSYTALRLMARLRTQLYQRLEPLAPAGLTQMRSGDLVSRAINDINQIEIFYAQTIAAAVVAVIVPLISLFVMSLISGWLALLFFPFLLAVSIAVPVLTDDLSKKYNPRLREAIGNVNAYMTESIQGWREIVSFGRTDHRRIEIHNHNERLVQVQGRIAEVSGLRDALTESLVAACIASVFIIGLWLSSIEVVSFFYLPAVVALAYTTFGPMLAAHNVVYEFNQATASANRLYEIMDQQPAVQETALVSPAEPVEPSIQFEAVYFRYPKNELHLMSNEEWFGLKQQAPNGNAAPEPLAPDNLPQQTTNGTTSESVDPTLAQNTSADLVTPLEDETPVVEATLQLTQGETLAEEQAPPASTAPVSPTGTDQEQQAVIEHSLTANTWVLADLSFSIPAGKTVAIVGTSGVGKSTIVNLLLRFWDVAEGHVRIGGYDVRDFPLEDLRSHIGVVSQRTHIFNTTIKENLLLGKPDATDAEIEHAAQLANIHDFIVSLKDGYKTQVGESGAKLSGGQRQRLAIARTLLKNAPILILDEATSNLDAVNERAIQTAIHTLMEGRTTLVIAHRLSSIINADEILVLDKGQVVERGKHIDLLRHAGVYARLFANQQDELYLS